MRWPVQEQLPGPSSWTWLRLRKSLQHLSLLSAILVLTGSALWPVCVCAFLVILQEIVVNTQVYTMSPHLYRLLPGLGRLSRVLMVMAGIVAVARGVEHVLVGASPGILGASSIAVTGLSLAPDVARRVDPVDERLGAALAYSHAMERTRRVKPELVLKDGRLLVTLPDGTTLTLPTQTKADRLLAMVLARSFQNSRGRVLFSSKELARVFGYNSRQSVHNPMQNLHNANGSLALMLLRSIPGRSRYLTPVLERMVTSFWERDPFATPLQCHQWLATQSLPEGTELPSAERLGSIAYIPGNLVTVRRSTARLFSRTHERTVLRHESLLSTLFGVIDSQDRTIQMLKGEPVVRSGLVQRMASLVHPIVRHPTRTSSALYQAIAPLTTVLKSQEDEALMNQVGLKELSPLHCATLYCMLRLSISQVATLFGKSKSVVYRELVRFSRAIESLELFPPAQHFSGILGLDEKWLKIPKSYSKEDRLAGKKWRYAHFAVDACTGDLLHVEVYETKELESARAFVVALRAMGIRPRVVVTDLWSGYEGLIRELFGERVIHHFCLFHHLQAVREQMRQKCGKDWKQSALLRHFVSQVDRIYDCRDRRTARKRLEELTTLRSELESQHPEAVPILDLVELRFPKVVNSLGTHLIPSTNNITERVIRAFNQHYKTMAGLESIESARVQLKLFRFFYRMTPQRERIAVEERGTCPLERAGWELHGIPIADYVRALTEAFVEEPSPERPTASRAPPDDHLPFPEQSAA